ncbi:glycosyltransferase family 4 protein [Bacillus sp. V2I10]|uniref:glycosyltransferase family 4 protein n=1 Tax=Bacillus sp. V2I10 TaxID=3042276 RepID=UPI002782D39F|nr:glycosyltransferase family 4 protein [Bacillus sp. V2I10]MDQ0859277.1 glycosyltransferase EpsD [Bacillus sp. V2I10]
MPDKVLFTATVDYHFKSFHLPILKWFKEQGWEVHVAALGNIELPYVDQKYNLPIQRSPFNSRNSIAFGQLKNIINQNHYSIIHCHTPVGGVLTRLAAREARKKGTKVIYTAHGFHFCKGAPIQNWLTFYPIEKWLSAYTDCLITINEEDYLLAMERRFAAGKVEHVHGVGVDTEKFKPISENEKMKRRKTFGMEQDDFILFYAAEFNKNKNQQFLLHAMSRLKDNLQNAKLLLAGEGALLEECKQLTKTLGIEKMVHFLGFRKDIDTILPMCDLAVGSSLREGLPVNIMEAMACGLPVVATENRGHGELVVDGVNGYIVRNNDVQTMKDQIYSFATDHLKRKIYGSNGRILIENQYSIKQVLDEKSKIYKKYMRETEALKWAVL